MPLQMRSGTRAIGTVVLFVLLTLGCQNGGQRATLLVARGRLAFVPVEVSASEGWFLLDTGCEGSIVSPDFGALLGDGVRRSRVTTFGGDDKPADAPRVKSGGIRFAGSRLRYPEEVTVMDVAFLSDLAGARVDGILGWDVLRNYVWGIDVGGARLMAGRDLSPQTVLSSLGAPRADAVLTMEFAGNLPLVTAFAGTQSLRLGLDTGAERTVLSESAFKRLGLELPPSAAIVISRGVNGEQSGRIARLAELRLGPLVRADVEVTVRDTGNSSGKDGLLGMDRLGEYRMVVDGPSGTLYLARPPEGGDDR